MVNMAGNSRQTSSTKMSKCNWTNELVNDLIDLVEEREVIWNAKAKVYHDEDTLNVSLVIFSYSFYIHQYLQPSALAVECYSNFWSSSFEARL